MVRPRLRDLARDRTLALMLALGFSSGLPFLLVLGTQALRLTEGTVRNYLSEAISKLGAHNRLEAARLARAKGWL